MSCSMDLSQTVQISDDENTEMNCKSSKNTSPDDEDVIIIDDDIFSQKSKNESNNCTVNSGIVYIKKVVDNYDDIYEENQLFSEYIEKLLNLENSEGMLRIVNRNLVKKYRDSKEYFRKSSEFKKVLENSLRLLDVDPDHKFSNVKNICNLLKNNGIKRIAPKLLTKELKSFTNHKIKRNIQRTDLNKKTKVDVIDLENYSPIDLDDQPMEIIDLEDSQHVNEDVTKIIDSEKENLVGNHENTAENHNNVVVVEKNEAENHENYANEVMNNNNSYLVPLIEVEWNGNSPTKQTSKENLESIDISKDESVKLQNETECTIKAIEAEISSYIVIIEQLEKEEVSNYDSEESPYIKSERYKAKIVKLYNKLCQLTGSVPVKHHTVRLDVLEGHPSGAVKLLEAFINNNIGSDGLPPFPDINDVIKCVELANLQDNLNWSKRQIMKESSALFTQCGRALQKRRQKREYRDLISRARIQMNGVEGVHWDLDPADKDPSLQAKLDENRRIALKKERDLLEKYTRMELEALNPIATHDKDSDVSQCDETRINIDLNGTSTIASTSQLTSQKNNLEIGKDNYSNNGATNLMCYIKSIESLSTELNKNSQQTCTDCKESNKLDTEEHSKTIEKDQSQIVNSHKTKDTGNDKLSKNTNEIDKIISNTQNDAKEINVTVKQEPSNDESKETQDQGDSCLPQIDCVIEKEPDYHQEELNTEVIPDVKIKREPLEMLFSGSCENFEVTVFDIEDPFLIINISDSSDDD